ncbi:hypothetical protein HAX54_041617 [Datura stramonium]|uniref:Uncharacterized protein n=1 Tax=Datura stramonium TaxID=4076 RepID=A0ABS8VXB0_DATST|nr:hypothetical protein [Datura stramonium]
MPGTPANEKIGTTYRPGTTWSAEMRRASPGKINLMGQHVKADPRKGLASSSHGSKRPRMGQEDPNKDTSMQPQPPRRYGLH